MKAFVRLLALVFLISSSACATMLKGTTDQITVISDPPGAKVAVNSADQGTTPVTFTVPSKQDLNIEVSKAGYQTESIQNQASFRWGWEIWAFLIYIIPFVVDLSSGAAWGHQDLTITTHLQPIGDQPHGTAATPAPAATYAPTPSPAATSTTAEAAPSAIATPSATPTLSWAPPPAH